MPPGVNRAPEATPGDRGRCCASAHRVLTTALLTTALFWTLAGALMVASASLMAGHWYTLPSPPTGHADFVRAMTDLRGPKNADTWMAVHVLYSRCRCSQRIFDHLFASERRPDVEEHILLVGAHRDYEGRARARGFAVHVLEPAQLKALYRIESAPLLLILDPPGNLRYAGGYTDRKQGPAIHDLDILARLVADETTEPLPLFGCGVSRELQALLDPIGIKYGIKYARDRQ